MPANFDTAIPAEPDNIRRRIAAQFEITMGNPVVVSELCTDLRNHLHHPLSEADEFILESLAPYLRVRSGPIAVALFSLVEEFVGKSVAPWPLLENMLCSREDSLAPRALHALMYCMKDRKVTETARLFEVLAKRCDEAEGVYQQSAALDLIADALECGPFAGTSKREIVAQHLYVHAEHDNERRLAARVLDRNGQLPSAALAARLLGRRAHKFLAAYLDFTRASHLDVLRLARAIEDGSAIVDQLRASQHACGPGLLRQVITELGWSRLNYGIEVRRCVGVSVAGSLPLMLRPEEVVLFQACGEAQSISESFLVIAHGGIDDGSASGAAGNERVERYRAYNLIHAELLDLILRVEPLTRERVFQILERMDRVVEDFIALFSAASTECGILRDVYGTLKQKILAEVTADVDLPQLSPELTRLVQMFEEPRSIGTVRTVHGLKRYLHQQGLKLSFGLIETGRQFSRTVDVLTITADGEMRRGAAIRYADFEPEADGAAAGGAMPYAASVVAEGFGRQMLYGQESFPNVDIFCYGNEVHYYLSYRNHPAFLRIDYSPPLRGGMVDLEYYGVSNYELGVHPNIALDAVQLVLHELGFDVQLSGTRIHARCDKESVTDLGTLCERVEALFRLAPYLMDIDWTIGSLDLPPEARQKVAEAWAESFALWGVLPIHKLLTADRKGVLETVIRDAAGAREVAWSGHGDYRDVYSGSPPPGFFERLSSLLEALELQTLPLHLEDNRRPMGQVRLEQRLFSPLRLAVQRGELTADEHGFHRLPQSLFRSEHEADHFADIVAAGLDTMTQAVVVARVIMPLERTLRFSTTGALQSYEVERAFLPLRGRRFGLYVLRDTKGTMRMAFYSPQEVLCRRRNSETEDWTSNRSFDIQALSSELRRNSYFVTGPELAISQARQEAAELLADLRRSMPRRRPAPLAGERVLHGLSAAPGRVTGPILFGTENRTPEDLDGSVLLAEVLRPDDNAYLYHCGGVVTTGGGVLSHAGLMALQFSKPAMIIPGRWQRERDGSQSLLFMAEEFTEEVSKRHGLQVTVRRHLRQREFVMREGDLVVLDATRATLDVLGHNRDVVSLHEELRQYGTVVSRMDASCNDAERLKLQGQKMRARYLIEKVLSRLTDPVIERYAVHELLLDAVPSVSASSQSEYADWISILLRNPSVGADARSYATWLTDELAQQLDRASSKAIARIPLSSSLFEILTLRLELLRLHALLTGTAAALGTCGVTVARPDPELPSEIGTKARRRLELMHDDASRQLAREPQTVAPDFRQRHRRRQLELVEQLLEAHGSQRRADVTPSWDRDYSDRASMSSGSVLMAEECGFDTAHLIGWKAANLAEVGAVFGRDVVPPWFVVTDTAFRGLLATPLAQLAPGSGAAAQAELTLQETIAHVLARTDLTNSRKSQTIRALWDGITLPAPLAAEIVAAYRQIEQAAAARAGDLYVALRSSSREEDAEIAARAGEFETFLFVRGEHPLLEHLKRTWSSLWTERALHNRAVLGIGSDAPGGGVIIQRIVRARVSGVVLTANIASGEPGEMIINVGYGMGEGVVSGRVAADQVTVMKEESTRLSPMRFKYVISDKQEQVVFNERSGAGTMLTTTLYHQRLRPALEYVELLELVSLISRFEAAYGYPLDVEFAFEETKLWILQVRPVAAFASIVRETLERHPLTAGETAPLHHAAKEILS